MAWHGQRNVQQCAMTAALAFLSWLSGEFGPALCLGYFTTGSFFLSIPLLDSHKHLIALCFKK